MKIRLSLFVIVLVGLLATLPGWADSNIRIIRLSLVDGPVQLDRATGNGFERAIMNMPIAEGMAIWTRDDSRAEVEFEEGNTIRLATGTKLEFSELVLRADGSRHTLLRVEHGRVYVNYSHNSGEDFRLLLNHREVVLDHSVRFRADVLDERTELAVLSGELNLDNVRVKKHNTLVLLARGAYDLAKGISSALEDDWDNYRNGYHDKYARSAYNGSSFYGRSDLNYYGTWMDSAYGSCWQPYGVGANWSPYQSGAWAYYPGYGYTWVSLYPWGWQPYRSGAWNYIGASTGYCWTPNRRYYGYGWAPVYNAPYGYAVVQPPAQPPRTPGNRGPGSLGIVPVGSVSTTGNWKPTDPIVLDRGHRGHRGETSSAVAGSASGSGGNSGAVSATTDTSNRGSRYGRDANTPAGESHHQASRSDVPANRPMPDRSERLDRSVTRQQPSQDHGNFDRAPREQRSFERPSGPPPSAPAPAAAPAPAPPPAAAPAGPSRSGSRGANPK